MEDATQPDWLTGYVPNPAKGSSAFVKGGPSPNPAGRPKGVLDRRQKLMRQIMEDASEVVDAILAKAKEGDSAHAALVLNRILPTLRSQSQCVTFEFDPSLPIARQVEQVLAAVAAGEVAPDIGQQIVAMVNALGNLRAVEQLEERLISAGQRLKPPDMITSSLRSTTYK